MFGRCFGGGCRLSGNASKSGVGGGWLRVELRVAEEEELY
jgi:hypothetical protein